MAKTLDSTIAGSWYPKDASAIRACAAEWESSAGESGSTPPPNIVILPHAGWAYSGRTAWCAARRLKGARFTRVVLLAPSHRAWIENRLVAPESDGVSTPLGRIGIDRDWIDRLALLAPVVRNDKVHLAEHAAQIEYPLLQLALGSGFSIVPLVMGSFGREQMGMCARAISRLMDADTLLGVSSDFTHYGEDFDYAPYGTAGGEDVRTRVSEVDGEAFSFMEKGDADGFAALVARTGATICGHVPIELALRAFPAGTSLVRQRYATSSDDTGDYSRFVCYLAAGRAGAGLGFADDSFVSFSKSRAPLRCMARRRAVRDVPGGGLP